MAPSDSELDDHRGKVMPRHSAGRSPTGAQPAAAPPAAQPPAQQPAAQAPPPPPPAGLPSPQGIVFDTVLVQPEGGTGLTVPRFTLTDGRSASQAQVTFVPQRFVEMVLFNRGTDGGSSGAVYKLLGKVGLGSTAWLINAAAVYSAELSQVHADFILVTFKDLLPSNSDAILGGRTRNVTLRLPPRTALVSELSMEATQTRVSARPSRHAGQTKQRFRQVMMLVREFRTEWPNQSLLSNDDVEFIRVAIDTALAMAEREEHTSVIYTMSTPPPGASGLFSTRSRPASVVGL